jgi:predicted CXXCH cytochrome family protein
MSRIKLLALALCAMTGLALVHPTGAQSAADAACIKCHKETGKSKVVHDAMKEGCVKCHAALDGSTKPHRTTNKIKAGLSAKGDAYCYTCHDKAAYAKKSRHRALRTCTDCHDPHASPHEKLLVDEPEKLCLRCHELKEFEGKFMHDPVKEGACTSCHDPHASDHPTLLVKEHTRVCMSCHAKVRKTPHAVSGFSSAGHPIGGEKAGLMDPLKPDQPFYCGSCHQPHASNVAKLIRLDPNDPKGDFCQQCHRK